MNLDESGLDGVVEEALPDVAVEHPREQGEDVEADGGHGRYWVAGAGALIETTGHNPPSTP